MKFHRSLSNIPKKIVQRSKYMTFEWLLKEHHGQYSVGFREVYETKESEEVSCMAILYYYPQLDSTNNKKIIHLTLFFVGSKQDLSDGLFHWIHDDICELVKIKEGDYYRVSGNPFSIIYSEVCFLKELPILEYYTHGDYSCELM